MPEIGSRYGFADLFCLRLPNFTKLALNHNCNLLKTHEHLIGSLIASK
jgi:hypothetical protein